MSTDLLLYLSLILYLYDLLPCQLPFCYCSCHQFTGFLKQNFFWFYLPKAFAVAFAPYTPFSTSLSFFVSNALLLFSVIASFDLFVILSSHLFPYHLTLFLLSSIFSLTIFLLISFALQLRCTRRLHSESFSIVLYISVLFSQLNYLSSSF